MDKNTKNKYEELKNKNRILSIEKNGKVMNYYKKPLFTQMQNV